MILYPTETVYGLGVNALDPIALNALYALKGRDVKKAVSWLVRDLNDITQYAIISDKGAKIAERFLPGPLTLVLPAKQELSVEIVGEARMVGFRVSRDSIASELIAEFMKIHEAPLTCTSANVSGEPTCISPKEILAQFGEKAAMITKVIDDGVREGLPSTVVRVVKDSVEIIREGHIPSSQILRV